MLFPNHFWSPLFLDLSLPVDFFFFFLNPGFIVLFSVQSVPLMRAENICFASFCLLSQKYNNFSVFHMLSHTKQSWENGESSGTGWFFFFSSGFPSAQDYIHWTQQIAEFPLEYWEAAQTHYSCILRDYSCSRVFFFPLSLLWSAEILSVVTAFLIDSILR